MTDLLTRAWHALTPEQRPDKLEPEAGGWRYGSIRWEGGEAAVYALLCVACEMVLMDGGWRHSHDGWYLPSKLGVVTGDTCRLTAAVLAIEAMKGDHQ